MNCELRFSKVLNLKVGKHLSKQTHGVWILLACPVWVRFPSVLPEWGKEHVVMAPASLGCAQCWELGTGGVGTRHTGVPWGSSGCCAWLAVLTVGSWAALEAKLKQKDLILGWWGDGSVWVWMFHPMHVLLSSCSTSLVLARVWFHVSTNLFCKIPMLTNAQWLLELMDLKCLYFHSSCLYWLISVAINSMGLWNLMHAGRSCLRNLYFPWHCSVSFCAECLTFSSPIPRVFY